ncbi:RDD family protein [Candidatus Mesenet endosymbiont of Phosphuga atrata]|uniref:RDD family protein n=1 Tax=Candidatus Mesenet endosymbiont of Phosphuga atrata TaxID=3066221 RepID=UPI0030D2D3FA
MSSIYLEPADLVRRFIAFCVDGLIISLVIPLLMLFPLLILFFTSIVSFEQFSGLLAKLVSSVSGILAFVGIIVTASLPILYYTYLTSSFRQATLGQRFMNMYVVRLNRIEIRAGFALIRSLMWVFLPSIIEGAFILIVINFLDESTLEAISFVFFIALYIVLPVISNKNQMIHDMLCKTVVVKGRLEKAN